MFTVTEIAAGSSIIQFREEHLTGIRCRISPQRILRRINSTYPMPQAVEGCPFCEDRISTVTPTFENGRRICIDESVTFPNLYPFGAWHTVTVITREHRVQKFSRKQLVDAFQGQLQALSMAEGYPSINWNYLPSAGASLAHPHLQGLVDDRPAPLAEKYICEGRRYLARNGQRYFDALKEQEYSSERFLFDNGIFWTANAVPLGEREVRGILPVSSLNELEQYLDVFVEGILRIIDLFLSMGTHAFNLSLFFDRNERDNGFLAFCSMISRINPNPSSLSDSAFMERIHLEPVILTLPEQLGVFYRKEK